jgi:uncharacterized membrane protein
LPEPKSERGRAAVFAVDVIKVALRGERQSCASSDFDEVRRMVPQSRSMSRRVSFAIYGLLNPIPFGMFVAALVFDIVYFRTGEVLWGKAAAWLIPLGLIVAIVPRFINLGRVWIARRVVATRVDRLDFWLYLGAVIAAIVNAFVHSRDAYGSMPAGVWLSAITVALIALANIFDAVQAADAEVYLRD